MMFKLTYDKAVLETDSLTTAEAMVALSWASVCDYNTGSNVRQSFEAVAGKAKMSRRNVIRITQALVEKGWLKEVERQPYKPTVYALTIPETSDSTSLVTDETALVTNETRLVTNEAPTSDTMSPNKNITRTKDKNKDKNKSARSAPGQSEDTNPSLAITGTDSLDPSVSDSSLASSTEADAPPLEEDEEIEWDLGEETPEAPERNQPARETQDDPAPVTEAPGGLPGASEVRRLAGNYARRYTPRSVDKFVDQVMQNAPGWTGSLDDLLAQTQEIIEGESW